LGRVKNYHHLRFNLSIHRSIRKFRIAREQKKEEAERRRSIEDAHSRRKEGRGSVDDTKGWEGEVYGNNFHLGEENLGGKRNLKGRIRPFAISISCLRSVGKGSLSCV